MNKYLILLIILLTVSGVYGQEEPYFEGTISYEVELKGPQAPIIQENEPNTQMQMHIKGASYITVLKGGRYPKTFIFVADSNREYSVNYESKMAYRFSAYSDRVKEQKARPKAVATGQLAMVNEIECEVFKVKTEDSYFLYFVNEAYRVNLALYPEKIRARPFFLIDGLEGRIPLKVIKKQRGLTVTQLAKTIKPKIFDEAQFKIPSNFTVKNRDLRH